MKKEIIISESASEIRIAITEDGSLAEIFFESPENQRIVGDIYLGRVAKVIPGIKAAFIDLGFKQDAFLHFSDVGDPSDEFKALLSDKDADIDDDEDDDDEEENVKPKFPNKQQRRPYYQNRRPSYPRLEKDQNIAVQITKEPVGTKGVRVTSKVSIPGRYLVLLPFEHKVNASRQIENLRDKRRLKGIVRKFKAQNGVNFGAIIRTVAEDQTENAIVEDLNNLLKTWKEIESNTKNGKPPKILYKDLSMTTSVIRDLLRDDVVKVICDSKNIHKEILSYLNENSPQLLDRVIFYKDSRPLFDVYGIEKQIRESINKKIPLKSGGYIFIEHTEAMVVIDVNSGKYARSRDQELNSLKTDLEAAREIVRQLRLRDIGGIIVIDFIDVYEDKNKKKVYDELKKEFRKDKAKATILPMSEFGIVQITRQRVRQSLIHSLSETCPMCGGTGMLESSANIIIRLDRWIKRYKSSQDKSKGKLALKVNPYLYNMLRSGFISNIRKLSLRNFTSIKLIEDGTIPPMEFKFINTTTEEDITKNYTD